ncbi:DUF1722 domain-containing protein, partial [Helcococcus bovis]
MKYNKIRTKCEKLWAVNKYYVLSKSHKSYLEIREYLKNEEIDFEFLQQKIEDTKSMKESKKDFNNSILHIWGYFKNSANEIEKKKLFIK